MGLTFGALNKLGFPGLNTVTTGQVYSRCFEDKQISDFTEFHIAYVECCNYFNSVMPGQDFVTPSRDELKGFYEQWDGKDASQKKDLFLNYMREKVKAAKTDDGLFIFAGLAAPTAAILAKRSGESIPHVKKLKYIPNVVFVPLCTLIAIMGASAVQISRRSKSKST